MAVVAIVVVLGTGPLSTVEKGKSAIDTMMKITKRAAGNPVDSRCSPGHRPQPESRDGRTNDTRKTSLFTLAVVSKPESERSRPA